jgi:hypothetical protein
MPGTTTSHRSKLGQIRHAAASLSPLDYLATAALVAVYVVGTTRDGDRAPAVKHQRGVTDSPGLYFLGLSWQHTRGSALLGWVKDDAEHIAQQIDAFRPSAPVEAPTQEREDERTLAPAASGITSTFDSRRTT